MAWLRTSISRITSQSIKGLSVWGCLFLLFMMKLLIPPPNTPMLLSATAVPMGKPAVALRCQPVHCVRCARRHSITCDKNEHWHEDVSSSNPSAGCHKHQIASGSSRLWAASELQATCTCQNEAQAGQGQRQPVPAI